MAKKRKYPLPEICACPPGARTRVDKSGALACFQDVGKGRAPRPVDVECGLDLPRHTIGRPTRGTLATPTAFNYWTPSTIEKLSKKQREARGCLVETIGYVSKKGTRKGQQLTKKVPLPYRCPEGSEPDEQFAGCRTSTGDEVKAVPDPACGKYANPCAGAERRRRNRSCPVQLVYVDGKPQLRFCLGSKQPGWLVPVKSPTEAQQVAAEACEQWKKAGRHFTRGNVAAVMAKTAWPQKKGLGEADKKPTRARRRRRRRRP